MEILLSCLALFFMSIGVGKLLSYGLSNRNADAVREANEENEEKQSVFLKKYKEVDMNRWQTTTRLMGFALALTFLLVSAETFTKNNKVEVKPMRADIDFPTINTWVDPTEEIVPPPPPEKVEVPPPPKPPEIEHIIEVEDVIDEPPVIEIPDVEDKEIPIPAIPVPIQAIDKAPPPVVAPAPPPIARVEENKLKDVIHEFVSVPPEFENGINNLRKQVQGAYDIPRSYIGSGEKGGTIVARFVVMEDGSIGKVEILKGLAGCESCDEEAVKAIKGVEGKFSPGKQAGVPVKVWFTLPIVVRIR